MWYLICNSIRSKERKEKTFMAQPEATELLEAFSDDENNEVDEDVKEKARTNPSEVMGLARALKNQAAVFTTLTSRLRDQQDEERKKLEDAKLSVKANAKLPYLVGNIIELIDPNENPDEDFEDGAAVDQEDELAQKSKSAVIKTSTRQTIFLPLIGLVAPEDLVPGDLVGTNKDSYLVLTKLPTEYDSRVKSMELEINEGDDKIRDSFTDVGGLEKQIDELREAVIMPITSPEMFHSIGIRPPKGVLLWGPPGTGKTMLARACAAETDAVFLKLAGPSLVQMFIGDGAKMIRDAFDLAREKSKNRKGAIIFIDEIDAIGGKRFDSDASGDREVQRTMLELLNQLDGFSTKDNIKVIAATNRPDVLDPALMRSGRLDRKVELPHPTEEARAHILRIHARALKKEDDSMIDYKELARATEDFNGAQLKAVCVEAGMLAVRRDAELVSHEDFVEGIAQVMSKKRTALEYYA
eukprot:maker-scaffold_24-snap-gene-2.3-mRNA-1 protein AED:0.02 eAED:0.02 QI:0/0/0/0.5/0/0/2/0/468